MFRLRDILIAGSALIVLSPVMGLISIVLYIKYGSIFFVQKRPGKDEQLFPMLKFSKMWADVRWGRKAQLGMTPFGHWLQRTSLDELPQLINVLLGHMSLVGPRPLLEEYLPLYTETEKQRHLIRPGITGWAQVNGRSSLDFKARFVLDVWYVQNRSHLLDLKILWMTVGKVLRREGNRFEGGRMSE